MTFSEMVIEFEYRISVASTNTFFTNTMLKSWINQANVWACAYRKWPFMEKRETDTAVASQANYNYPSLFKSDSIKILRVDSERYTKVRYEDYLKYLEDNSNGADKIYSDFGREYFVNPNAFTAGKTIEVYGYTQQTTGSLSIDTHKTPFADNEEEGNEAIIKKALSIALLKGRKKRESQEEEAEAILLLKRVWARIQEEQQSYQTKDRSLFKRIDILRGGKVKSDYRGRF